MSLLAVIFFLKFQTVSELTGYTREANDLEHLQSAIRYVQRHPEKEGLRAQSWKFVVPLDPNTAFA